jgi:hypothetical protein
MDENETALIAEQLKHALDLMRGEIDALRCQQGHDRDMVKHRLDALEEQARDHETRLRSATDGVVQFKMWAALTSGGSGLLSLAALAKAFLGW